MTDSDRIATVRDMLSDQSPPRCAASANTKAAPAMPNPRTTISGASQTPLA